MHCIISVCVCVRRSTQSWLRRCCPIRGTLWSTSGWRMRSTTSLPAAHRQPWTASRRWPSSRAWRSLSPTSEDSCVSNKAVPPAPVHFSFPSPALVHTEKPFTMPNHGKAERPLAVQAGMLSLQRGERLAKAESSDWPRASQTCLLHHWEVLRWTFMKCWGVLSLKTDPLIPFILTQTQSFADASPRVPFVSHGSDPAVSTDTSRTALTGSRIESHGYHENEKAFSSGTWIAGRPFREKKPNHFRV